MHQRYLTPSFHGPLRLRVLSVRAGRPSGGSTTHPIIIFLLAPTSLVFIHYHSVFNVESTLFLSIFWGFRRYKSERPGSSRDRPWAGRANRGNEDERRDERRYGSQGDGEYGGGKRYGAHRQRESGEGRRGEDEWRRRRHGGDGHDGTNRRNWPVSEATSGPDNRRAQQKPLSGTAAEQPQQLKRRERDDYGDGGDDRGYDTEYDEASYEDAGEGDERTGAAGGRRRNEGSAAGPCLRDTLQGEALYGVFPVLAALRAKRRKVHRAFILSSMDLSKRKDAGLVRQVEALCSEAGVEVVRTGRHELNLMSYDRPHQLAEMDEFPPADEVIAAAAGAVHGGAAGTAAPPVWLALDEVVDPQNLGAVVRSAYCLGAGGVLACARNCAPLSAVVSKASAGALEALQVHSCRNLPRTLMDARDRKGWTVLGAAAGSGSEAVGRVVVDRPTILVLGSEGFGLRTNVRRACSGLVRVDMAPPTTARAGRGISIPSSADDADAAVATNLRQPLPPSPPLPRQQQPQHAVLRGLVDSLNVSVATGILLHSLINSAASTAAAGPSAATATGAVPADTTEISSGRPTNGAVGNACFSRTLSGNEAHARACVKKAAWDKGGVGESKCPEGRKD
ncbi:hypothetical protein VOLCADRAFT_103485 [Volvox carteri f. nagariensis]|uniref:rRNA methyltransferase 1, mitochondrial n=1 Tax=Volvox carteri f. nagariensis TaxID=3068 RepID=D8TM78_VOLCA|nr:uncharacterized protein VOLCADRAFT_103485 [Volvox carteri f. nagariensis]EFJ51595.1 hypothetical protein VOLCADRAFT_103485 [Volvox carteri f. nagariensis]|eukprot:XP_002947547.1 hypothetical protein VOLCADRAFT_103485 [Volvox carteri f. nagariensis]